MSILVEKSIFFNILLSANQLFRIAIIEKSATGEHFGIPIKDKWQKHRCCSTQGRKITAEYVTDAASRTIPYCSSNPRLFHPSKKWRKLLLVALPPNQCIQA
jgi:hypothetical protein